MKRPTIEEMTVGVPGYLPPEQRKCRGCGEVLKPCVWDWVAAAPEKPGVPRYLDTGGSFARVHAAPAKVGAYGYGHGDNLFCSLGCAYRLACRVVTGGNDAAHG